MNPIAFLHRQLSYFAGLPEDRRIALFRTDPSATPLFAMERARILLRRTEVLAWVFMVLVPLWIFVDMRLFPSDVLVSLATGRVTASVLLGILLLVSIVMVKRASMATAYVTLLFLLAIPVLFGVFAQSVFLDWQALHPVANMGQQTAEALYASLPLIYIAGLALFPMTLTESLPVTLAVTGTVAWTQMHGWHPGRLGAADIAQLWALLVIGAAAALAGTLQLNLLWQNHRLRTLDGDNGPLNRKAALELMQAYWNDSARASRDISVALLDCRDADPSDLSRLIAQARESASREIFPVRWSASSVGLLGIGGDMAGLERRMHTFKASAPQHRTHAVALVTRASDHAISPLNLLQIAERKLA